MQKVDTNDDLFDDQIADAIWEAASNGDGRITAASLRRELALLGIQIVSKAYYDSIAAERDELASKLAEADALAKHYEKCCDSYADENQKFHDRFTSAESALTAANAEIARLRGFLTRCDFRLGVLGDLPQHPLRAVIHESLGPLPQPPQETEK